MDYGALVRAWIEYLWSVAIAMRVNSTFELLENLIVGLVAVAGSVGIVAIWVGRSHKSVAASKEKKPKVDALSRSIPARVPFIDKPKRPLRISKNVIVALDSEHGCSVGMTRSGKSSTMAGLVDGQEATIGCLFDISLPVTRKARLLQRAVKRNKLKVHGRIKKIPVFIWRPRDKTVVLRLLEGVPAEVIDSILDAWSKTSSDGGHQRGIVYRRGEQILKDMDARREPRSLLGVARELEKISQDPSEDAQTRMACFSWSTKILSLKAMFGEAEGARGFTPSEILNRGGTLILEFNMFSSKAATEAVSGFALTVIKAALNYATVPVNVLLDESGQLKSRIHDVETIFRASGARGGRAWLCTQDPQDLASALATNIGVWALFGLGAGATQGLKWMSEVTWGLYEPYEFIMYRRTLWKRFLRKLSKLRNRMHRECTVVYEGSAVFTTVDAPSLRQLKADLMYDDWPNNRQVIEPPPDMLAPDGRYVPPGPVDPEPPFRPTQPSPRGGARVVRETQPASVPVLAGTIREGMTGELLNSRMDEGDEMPGGEEERAPIPFTHMPGRNDQPKWVKAAGRDVVRYFGHLRPQPGARILADGRLNGMWLWGKGKTGDGRPKSSRVVEVDGEKVDQFVTPYIELYKAADQPNGPLTEEEPELNHFLHTEDETCPGGKKCIHILDCNPWNVRPVSHAQNVKERDEQRVRHNQWRKRQGMPALGRPARISTQVWESEEDEELQEAFG